MIAEPTLLSRSVQKENSVVDVSSCASVHHVSSERNENRQKTVRGKRKARECSENAKRKHSKSSNGSLGRAENEQLKNGDVEAVTLFEVVSMGRNAMQAVVDDWIDAYTGDRDSALLDLISFFIQCSGCKGMVTAEMFQSKKGTDVMSKMVEDLDEDSGEYPLIMSGLYWKRFRSHFCEFVSVLVAQCQNCVIFDGYLLNTLISLLTELSDSRVRAFRHTCTLAAVKLLSALVNVALNLSVSVDNSQRLYEVELAKMASKRASPRLDRIQRKISELQDRKCEIENMMDAIFKGVFLKRYRDVIPEIRAICMEELTVWMKLYSSVFLNDSYLKYVGWMMHDKQPDVRLKCVLGLQALYQDQSSSKMDLFTIRFKERMISMTLDKDHEVAIQAMRLLMVISQSCEDVLSPDDHKNVFQFVYCSHRPLATTAGEFLYNRSVFIVILQNLPLLCDTCTYMYMILHQHVLYLVDSLWDSAGALLKDWTGLTSLLLPHTSCQEQALSSAEEAFVIELILASVRQAAEGPPLSGRGAGKKVINTKEKKLQIDDCTKLTEHFIKVLPELLSKVKEKSLHCTVCFMLFFTKAFMCLSDVLIAHNYQLQMWDSSAGTPLLYTPDPKLQKALLSFVVEHVFTSPDECGDGRLEDLHRRRNLLAAYCKLIVHSVLEMSMATELFKQYVKFYNDFGDIIKETLNRTRQMDKMESARTLVQSCLFHYISDILCLSTNVHIKELARRFSLTFGWDQIKSRESLAMIHRDGIEFVFKGFVQQSEKHSPPYISYLTILSEFSSKLLKPDKKTIYSYLQKFAGEQVINNREESWMPLIYYRASLMGTAEGEDAISFISSDTNKQPSLSNRSRSPSVRQVNSEVSQLSNILLNFSSVRSSEDSKVQQAPLSREQLSSSLVSDKVLRSSDEVDVDTVDIDG
uniref:Cohesin subunit SA n=1 Tax=Cyprinus carpio TaxID=7962 RepID=A0A8C1MDQ9_CYPCA